MKHWTHDELHEMMDGDPTLKEKSDKAHAIPSNSLRGFADGKKQMTKIYAEAIGCKRFGQADNYLNEIIGHINKKCKTWEEWEECRKSDSFHNKLAELKDKYKKEKKCHSPAGNDYVCHCK